MKNHGIDSSRHLTCMCDDTWLADVGLRQQNDATSFNASAAKPEQRTQ